ncbi:MAG: S8 family serine peptidase [Bacteroidales bacterium]|nr:S8 family serine peptidase [Bacteroidales bacterium]
MKRTLAAIMLLVAAWPLVAQNRELKPTPLSTPKTQTVGGLPSSGLSATTAMLVADLYQGVSPEAIALRYHLPRNESGITVQLFATLAATTEAKQLERHGATIKTLRGLAATLSLPLDSLLGLYTSGLCQRLDIGVVAHPLLDQARADVGADQAYDGTGLDQAYDGTGVVVGIIDIGFQLNNPTFYDANNNTRIKRVWIQTSSSGPHPSGFDYGQELTSSFTTYGTTNSDEVHGTHVAGIATGRGGLSAQSRTYQGIASGADIVMVETTMSSSGIYDGIEYIAAYARSVGKPCVINMSIGGHIGPHDGTSGFDRYCDLLLQDHPTGLLLVGSAGNEANDSIHVSKIFTATDTLLYTVVDIPSGSGQAYIDIWGSVGSDFKAGFCILDSATGRFDATGYWHTVSDDNNDTETLTDSDNESITFDYYCGAAANNPNNRPEFYVTIDASAESSSRQKVLIAVNAQPGDTVHLWSWRHSFIDCGFSAVTAGDPDYSVGEIGGVGNSIISVGAYTTKNEWQSTNGSGYSFNSILPMGELTYFSSHGPTLDGRVKPNVAAPGVIVAPINRYSNQANTNNPYVVLQDGSDYFALEMGTSMAAPMVTGIIALWLQHNPDLSLTAAKDIISRTSRTDSHTGLIPTGGSNSWGYGKIDALGGLTTPRTPPTPHTPPTYTVSLSVNDPSLGTVSGAGTYDSATVITIVATPAANATFDRWNDADTHASRTITVNRNLSLTANFLRNTTAIDEADCAPLPTISVDGLEVSIAGATSNQEVTLVDMAGRTVATANAANGWHCTLPTRGIYVATINLRPLAKVVAF